MKRESTDPNKNIELGRKQHSQRLVSVLGLGIVLYSLGFFFLIFALSPEKDETDANPVLINSQAPLFPDEPKVSDDPLNTYPNDAKATSRLFMESEKETDFRSPEAPSELKSSPVPELAPPAGVHLRENIKWTRCWDRGGFEFKDAQCEEINQVQDRFVTRLHAIDGCRKEQAGERVFGTLNMGVELDFYNRSASYWNSPGSTLLKAEETVHCVQSVLKDFPMSGLSNKYERYRLFVSIAFTKTAPGISEAKTISPLPETLKGARRVNVTRDRVRVRAKPVDGFVLGHINSGNQVLLLDRQDEWCRVITPRQTEGWMICWALEVD